MTPHLLDAWRLVWPRAAATRHYAAAVTALMVAFIMTVITPPLLAGRWLTPTRTDAIAPRSIVAGAISGAYPAVVQEASTTPRPALTMTGWLA